MDLARVPSGSKPETHVDLELVSGALPWDPGGRRPTFGPGPGVPGGRRLTFRRPKADILEGCVEAEPPHESRRDDLYFSS